MWKNWGQFELVELDEGISREDFLSEIQKLNEDTTINGGFVQLPLPKHLQDIDTTELINSEKDMDGFGLESFAGLIKNDYSEALFLVLLKAS